MAFVNEALAQRRGARRAGPVLEHCSCERGQGYKQAKAIMGEEEPDLQRHVCSA